MVCEDPPSLSLLPYAQRCAKGQHLDLGPFFLISAGDKCMVAFLFQPHTDLHYFWGKPPWRRKKFLLVFDRKSEAVEDGTAGRAVFEPWMQQVHCCLIFPLISAELCCSSLLVHTVHSWLPRVHHLYHMGFSPCPCWSCQFSMLCKCCFEPRPYFGAEQVIHLLGDPGVKAESWVLSGQCPAARRDADQCMLLGVGRNMSRNASSLLRLILVLLGKDGLLFCPELCNRSKCNLQVSNQLIFLPGFFSPYTPSLGRQKADQAVLMDV